MIIVPYSHVGAIRFGMRLAELPGMLNSPINSVTNHRGECEYTFGKFSVRFSSEKGTVVEVGLLPGSGAEINGIDIFNSRTAFEELIAIDDNPFEYMGFIVLLKLGITLTGFHDQDVSQQAVTAFSLGRWDHLKPQLSCFNSRH